MKLRILSVLFVLLVFITILSLALSGQMQQAESYARIAPVPTTQGNNRNFSVPAPLSTTTLSGIATLKQDKQQSGGALWAHKNQVVDAIQKVSQALEQRMVGNRNYKMVYGSQNMLLRTYKKNLIGFKLTEYCIEVLNFDTGYKLSAPIDGSCPDETFGIKQIQAMEKIGINNLHAEVLRIDSTKMTGFGGNPPTTQWYEQLMLEVGTDLY
jgi:hypothetical protein